MKSMADDSIDCVITDPPYGLSRDGKKGFMGKEWDNEVPGQAYWEECLRLCKPGSFLLAFGAPRSHHHLAIAVEKAGWEITDCIMWIFSTGFPKGKSQLKPAYEPVILSRKPAKKCKHLNIDDCRIGTEERINNPASNQDREKWRMNNGGVAKDCVGRWPANIVFNEEAAQMLDEMSGVEASRFFYCAKASTKERNAGLTGMPLKECGIKNASGRGFSESDPYKKIEYKNHHPTVKPLRLMQYLIKLVMPKEPEAILLDPFAGSGSTILAAKQLGFNAIGIEKEIEYVEIARKRIESDYGFDFNQ